MHKSNRLQALGVLLAMVVMGAKAAKEHVFVVVGDDQSDRGNTFAVSKGTIPDPDYYFNGSFTNEPGAWSKQIDTPDTVIAIRNFARGGATACANAELKAQGVLSMQDQVADWKSKLNSSDYVDTLQGSNGTRPVSVVIWGGHNDLINAAKNDDADDDLNGLGDRIADCIQNVTQGMLSTPELEFAGVILVNLAPYDLSPVVQDTGRAAEVKSAIDVFNRRLATIAEDVKLSLTGKPTQVVLVDINTALNDAAGSFPEPRFPCLTYEGDYVPYEGGNVSSTCQHPDVHIWYDDYHPVGPVHTAVKDAIVNATINATLIEELESATPATAETIAGPVTPTARKLLF